MLHAAHREGKPPGDMVLGQFLMRGFTRMWPAPSARAISL